MLFVSANKGGHLVTFGIPTYCRGREHQAGDDPYAFTDDVEPVELNEHLYFSHHRSYHVLNLEGSPCGPALPSGQRRWPQSLKEGFQERRRFV